jgi:hypothetical protein
MGEGTLTQARETSFSRRIPPRPSFANGKKKRTPLG